ncbi:lactonase family protein [Aestuariivivens sediminis]|uniref:lactonase family protein n=1 Tax=Aestuariivivens sediminis TaxID=2913557 RepID=UPI001F5A01E8|nr:lactonase family protein [Aestuariivivens sediminis]
MKHKIFLLALSGLSFVCCSNPTIPLYVGTYTSGDSEGIYQFQFNTETGALGALQLAAKTTDPSYLCYSPDRHYLYAVNETKKGSVSAFKVDSNGLLSHLNTVESHGAHPCHIAINDAGNKTAVSNYSGGNVSLFTINDNGTLNPAFQVINHNTDSIVSHAHSAAFLRSYLYVADLGKNAVYEYTLENHNFKLLDSNIVPLPSKSGPRHFTFTADGKFIYIINELSSTITSAQKTNDGFEWIETISTLADDYNIESYCADIHLSEDERFLYGSNRGENSIVVFKRNIEKGTLEKIQNIGVRGDWPRNFTLDPTGKFLLVANQRSENISVFKIDNNTGTLSFMHEIKIASPVCLLF